MDPLGPLPPDPYKALGVPRDCEQSVIKSTYRKLVLKCHPDKVTDESLKRQKEEEFHQIQSAWELIGDEQKRSEYDALVTKQRLAREEFGKAGGRSAGVSGHYEVRTQAPAGTGASYRTTTAAPRYDEHKSTSRTYDDRYDDRSRKFETYDPYPKHTSSRTPREKESPKVRVSSDRTRSDHKKTRDREERSERSKRFVHVDSEEDEYQRFEHNYVKRSDEERKRREEDDFRRTTAQARHKADSERRPYEDVPDRQRKLNDLQNDAVYHMRRSRGEAERPSPPRTSSSREVPREYYDRSSRRDRPEPVRRSSARPSKDRISSSGRDRRGPQIVEWEDDDRKIPPLKQSVSSPPEVPPPRAMPQRSYTESSRDHRRETSPPTTFRRSETMPSVPHSSSRRKDSAVPRHSSLREPVTAHASGAPSTAYPTVPPTTNTAKYYYPTPEGGVRLSPDDLGSARRTVLVEPGRTRHRSTSPLSRPPMGSNRPVEASSAYTTAAPKTKLATPSLNRSQTYTTTSPARGSDGRLYGEMESDHTRRENARRQTNFDPNKVSYSTAYGPEHVSWAPRGRDTDRDYQKPSLNRTATYVY